VKVETARRTKADDYPSSGSEDDEAVLAVSDTVTAVKILRKKRDQ
jgi:hypothetical protein